MNSRGLYEILITVDENDVLKLCSYTKKNDLKMILVYNPVGQYRVQPMISKFKNGDFFEVYERAMTLRNGMMSSSLRVVRTKIEAMASAEIVPRSDEQLRKYKESKALYGYRDVPYVEFHLKTKSPLEAAVVHAMGKEMETDRVRVGASVNMAGVKKDTLVTVRVLDTDYLTAENEKNRVIDHLKKQGLTFEGALQQEFSVYDDHPALDGDWL